jgi:Ca2+:H+ antiporter
MKYIRAEFPIAWSMLIFVLGLSLEHFVIDQGGVLLWGVLLVILSSIIMVAFRISHHAEVLAAVSVEVVILLVLLQGAPNPTLGRDTIFSAVMFDINGILGLAAIIGGLKHGNSKYNLDSANSYIAMLIVSIGIGMFIPDFVPDAKWQLYAGFSIGIMAIIYLAFLRLQTVEHRQFFEYSNATAEEAHDLTHSPNVLHVTVMLGAIILVGLLSEILSVLLDAGLH